MSEAPEPTKCPWCGALGVDFDESPAPSDYCGHDPALVREKNRVAPVDELVNNS